MNFAIPPKEKVLLILFLALFASVFVASQLFIPQIFVSIVQHDHPTFTKEEAQAKASRYKSFLDGAIAFVNLFALPLLGSLSDVFGRRVIMAVTSYFQIVLIFILYMAYTLNALWLMYIMGAFSFGMTIQLCGIAYMGDIAKDEREKAKNYGVAMAAFMLGIIFGALVLGAIGQGHIERALYTMFGICILMSIIMTVLFKENSKFYQDRNQRQFTLSSVNPFRAVRLMLGKSTFVTILVLLYAFIFIGMSDSLNTAVLYAQYRWDWESLDNGILGALKGLMGVIWQGVILGMLLKRFSRQGILTCCCLATAIIYFFQGLVSKGWMFMAVSVTGGFSSITFPMLQALISEQIPKEQQGMALGGISSVAAIATIIGSLIGGNVFAWCVASKGFTCPGTIFYFTGMIYALSGLFFYILFKKFPPVHIQEFDISKSGTSFTRDEEGKELLITSSAALDEKDHEADEAEP
eukprot:Phypoly_transcript_08423.p1 GENE.Phypoly_transcript_08423~~Phypoly_transcript_08423.p1  ORF type:complete len:496 (+),score=61.86 Phypoly_transcript_08423:95-1489(+)